MIATDRRIPVAPARRMMFKIRGIMLWVAALLASIVWVLGLESGFLGFGIHIFLLAALLSGLAALLPPAYADSVAHPETELPHASSVPAVEGEHAPGPGIVAADERPPD